MSHAACQASHGIHFLRLAELSFELLPLSFELLPLYFMQLPLYFVPLQSGAHVLERPGDLRYLITTIGFQRIGEITLFEGAHSLRAAGQWTGGPIRYHKHQSASP